MICAGIDAGSRMIKVLLLDSENDRVIGSGVTDQGVEQDRLVSELFTKVLSESKVEKKEVTKVIATGYGRNMVGFAESTVTEISCHAAGVRRHLPKAKTIIDIGGQDSKCLFINSAGSVRDFAVNDRCAAGTGRFLEMVSEKMGVELEDLGQLAKKSCEPALINNTCVVFAETEIIGLLACGAGREDVVAGVQRSIAQKIGSMIGKKAEGPIVFTGGVALVPGMREALEKELGETVAVCPEPQMTGALGAAILAARQFD